MNARTTRARHRAARRPLGGLVSSTVTGRRAAVVAAAGGLLVSTLASAGAAQAAPVDHDASKKASTVDLGALSDQAREALQAAPVVTVDAKAKVEVEKVTAKVAQSADITPAPEPEPEPEPVVTETESEPEQEESSASSSTASSSTEAASRSGERTEAPAAESSNSSLGQQAVSIAMRYIGTPYVLGGASPSGFDCSGLTSYVYGQLGVDLPRSSSAQQHVGTEISASELRPGDLIWSPGHISIYAGDGMVVEASRPINWETGYHKMWQSESESTYLRVF